MHAECFRKDESIAQNERSEGEGNPSAKPSGGSGEVVQELTPRWYESGGVAWRLSAMALLTAVATAVGYLALVFVPRERGRATERWRAQLSAMASDRQSAVDHWLVNGLADAHTVASFPTVLRLVATAGTTPASSRAGRELRSHLGEVLVAFAKHGGYRSAALLDAEGRVLAQVGRELQLQAACLTLPRQALRQRRPLADLHLHAGLQPLLQLVAPIGPEAGAAPVGVVLLTLDPEDWLYPFLRHQPLVSQSEETLLAGRDGAEIVLLTPLRHRPDPPMTLRLPLGTPGLAAAAGVPGRRRIRRLHRLPWRAGARGDARAGRGPLAARRQGGSKRSVRRRPGERPAGGAGAARDMCSVDDRRSWAPGWPCEPALRRASPRPKRASRRSSTRPPTPSSS